MRTSVHVTSGRPGLPVAVILPGTGSTADFVTRAFGPALDAAGFALATADPEPGSDVVTAAFDALDEAVARHRPRLVGGVSLGAHVAARWAAARAAPGSPSQMWSPDGLLLALPAWTGPPADVAAASAQAAGQVREHGLTRTLADARRNAVPWIGEEITRAWPGYGDALADTLDAAAASAGPGVPELGHIRIPVGLVPKPVTSVSDAAAAGEAGRVTSPRMTAAAAAMLASSFFMARSFGSGDGRRGRGTPDG